MQERIRVVVEPVRRPRPPVVRIVGRSFLEAVGITALVALLILGIGLVMRARSHSAPIASTAAQPETWDQAINLLPGEYTNIQNRDFKRIQVRSEYPVRVVAGNCHSNYTVQFVCDEEAADIFITDTRGKPFFTTPKANAVSVHLVEF